MLALRSVRLLLRVFKWTLVALGAFLWVMLWWERHPLLGLAQILLIAYALVRELRPHLRGYRRNNPLRGARNPTRRP